MKCKYCNADVSPAEKICPKCNHSVFEDNPQTLAKKKRNKKIGIGVAIITFIFVGSTIGMSLMSQQNTSKVVEHSMTKTTQSASSSDTAAPTGDVLPVDYNLLMDRFNDNPNVSHDGMLMQELQKGATSFEYNLSPNINVSGKVSPETGDIYSLQMITNPQKQDDVVKMVTCIGVFVESFFPSDANDKRQTVLKELGFVKGGNIKNADNTSIQEDIRFRFQAVPNTGYVFTIDNKNNQ